MKKPDVASFTAANAMPWKTIHDLELVESMVKHGKILPRHMQIGPTSRCNLDCPFCSCKNRSQTELSLGQLKEIVDIASSLKTVGFTVTGDGEPLLHPEINEFIEYAVIHGIKIGLVSNGLKLTELDSSIVPMITWARISFSDFLVFNDHFIRQMDYLRKHSQGKVDLAFSYVVDPSHQKYHAQKQLENIKQVVGYANKYHFTHVRLVADLYQTQSVDMKKLKADLGAFDTRLCIFQPRTEHTKGAKKCLISLLKPMIASDGYLYPCCGVQYALPKEEEQRMFPLRMRMGHYRELATIIDRQLCFDGSVCSVCYYENYNTMLSQICKSYKHEQFV